MTFRIWDASDGVEIALPDSGCVIYAADDPIYPTHSGFGVGIVAERTLISGNITSSLPQSYQLGNAYPNPFNPVTMIPFALPTESKVRLEIFNILGQRVAVLQDGIMQAGNQKGLWNGNNSAGQSVASGVYLLKLEAIGTVKDTKFKAVSKLLLTK